MPNWMNRQIAPSRVPAMERFEGIRPHVDSPWTISPSHSLFLSLSPSLLSLPSLLPLFPALHCISFCTTSPVTPITLFCCTNLGSLSQTCLFFYSKTIPVASSFYFPSHLLVDIFTTTPTPNPNNSHSQWKAPSSKSLSTPRAPTLLTPPLLVSLMIPSPVLTISNIPTPKLSASPLSIVRLKLYFFSLSHSFNSTSFPPSRLPNFEPCCSHG